MRCIAHIPVTFAKVDYDLQCRLVDGHTAREGRRPKLHTSQIRRYIGDGEQRHQQTIVVRWTE